MNLPQKPRIVAIHGAPRSGTSWLGQLFNSSEHVAYRYQPLFSYAFKDRVNRSSTSWQFERFFNELLLTDDDFVLQHGSASLSGYSLDFPKADVTHLVYKEVRYHDILSALLTRVPETYAIGIVRHPCAVIQSWLNAPREFNDSWLPLEEWRDAPRKNLNKPENWYGFERWKTLATIFEQLQTRFPERFSIVRYESLITNPQETLSNLFSACRLPMTKQVKDFMKASSEFDDKSPYGVFRDASSVTPHWVTQLDPKIIDMINADLRDTSLERYLALD